MEASEQRRIIEALVLAATEPISLDRLAAIVPDCSPGVVKDRINELNTEYQEQDRSFEVWEVAGGYQIRTRAEFSGYLQQLRKERPLRLSQAALETLSIVAYKQPVTRGELEMVRGVDTGAVLKSLLERRLVRVLGHREVPGRPLLYGTTKRFLEIFGLESLKQLPSLRELEELAREQGLKLPGSEVEEAAEPSALDGVAEAVLSEDGAADAASIEADLSSGEEAAEAPLVEDDESDLTAEAEASDFDDPAEDLDEALPAFEEDEGKEPF
jgi:segregation and condensation protein B